MTFPIYAWTAPLSAPWSIRSMLALPIEAEPLTLDEGKLRAGLDWAAGDPRDALMQGFIEAARQQVEQDTGLAIPVQARDLFFDALPSATIAWRDLPSQSSPLSTVTALSWVDATGVITALDPLAYTVTASNVGIAISVPAPPAGAQRWILRIEAGFAVIPPSLLHAIGLLTGHYATIGRDVSIDERRIGLVPLGYTEAIQSWCDEAIT